MPRQQQVIKVLYVDFSKRFLQDVSNVLPPSVDGVSKRICQVLGDPDGLAKFIPGIHEICDKLYATDDEIMDLPVLLGCEDAAEVYITLADVVHAVDPKWKPMVLYHAWLIATAAHVYAHPEHLDRLRAVVTEEDVPAEGAAADEGAFGVYVSNLMRARRGDLTSKEVQLDSIFESTFKKDGAICRLAREITEELHLDEKIKDKDDVAKLLDFSSPQNVLGEVLQKVSVKLHDKLKNSELKQEDLMKEAMEMMSSLQHTFPQVSDGLFNGQVPDLSSLMKTFNVGGKKQRSTTKRGRK